MLYFFFHFSFLHFCLCSCFITTPLAHCLPHMMLLTMPFLYNGCLHAIICTWCKQGLGTRLLWYYTGVILLTSKLWQYNVAWHALRSFPSESYIFSPTASQPSPTTVVPHRTLTTEVHHSMLTTAVCNPMPTTVVPQSTLTTPVPQPLSTTMDIQKSQSMV